MSDRVKLFLSKEAKKNSGIYDYTNAKILNEKKFDKKKKLVLIDKTNPLI